MAETRKKSTTTKTKTVPAKKPATKPAGKSTTPKVTKTVKASTKTTKATSTKKTTVKTTKPAAAKTTSTKPAAKKECNICKIIFAIIIAVAVVAVATWAIICAVNKSNDTVMIENGKGDKVSLKYVSLDDYKYRVLVPTNFKKLSDEEIKADYGTDNAPELVYSDADDTVNIAFSAPNGNLTDSQIKDYLNTMKAILGTGMNILSSDTYEVDNHTIGVLRLVSDFDGVEVYNQMAFFSYEDKLAIITFNCKGEARAEWEKVGDEIIKSINFTK